MKYLLKELKCYKKEVIIGPLLKLMEATLELMVPLIIAHIIDKAVPVGSISAVVRSCLVLVLFGAVGLLFAVVAQYFAAKASVLSVSGLRSRLFNKLTSLSFSEIDEIGKSTMLTRMTSDLNQLQTGLNLTLRLFLRSPFIVFGAMIMAFTVDVPSALIFAVAIPLLAAVTFGIMLGTIPLYKKVQRFLDRVLSLTRENLTGVRVLRAFRREKAETEDFKERSDTLYLMQRFVGRISALLGPTTYVILNIAILVLIYTGAIRVESGLLSQGAVVALYNYMLQILTELIKLADLIITMTRSLSSLSRVADVLDLPENSDNAVSEGNEVGDIIAEFKDVSFRYKSAGEDSLSGISFTLSKGETLGIIGSTGSGKSTLAALIPEFYEKTSGEIYLFGREVADWNREKLRSKIGYCMQKAVLFKGTVRDNLLWRKADADDEELENALSAAEALEIIEKKGGLSADVEAGGRNFSGGQRQRISIARALVGAPELLILDDSFSALDYATEARVRENIANLSFKPTVIIISQRISSLRHADKIIVLDDGKIDGIGTHEELLLSSSVYREIVATQEKEEEI